MQPNRSRLRSRIALPLAAILLSSAPGFAQDRSEDHNQIVGLEEEKAPAQHILVKDLVTVVLAIDGTKVKASDELSDPVELRRKKMGGTT